jgi:hypothetical protein
LGAHTAKPAGTKGGRKESKMMAKKIYERAMGIARGTALTIGAAVMLALVLGVATTALAGTGVGARFQLGQTNTVNAVTKLVGSVAGPSLQVDNNSADASATALDLQVEAGKAPMKVNSETKVANLNADKLDGKSDTDFYAAGSKVADSSHADFATNAQNASTLGGKNSNAFAPSDVVNYISFAGDGGLVTRSSYGISVSRVSTGTYQVTFDRDVRSCAHIAQPLDLSGASTKTMRGGRYGGPDTQVRVFQYNSAGSIADGGISLAALC